MKFEEILDLEERSSFDFFWKEASLSDRGYGLIRDNTKDRNVASIASVGFGLSALPVGVERGWITRKSGEERVVKTLKSFLNNVEQKEGFFVHFIDMVEGRRANRSEVSVIDTALFLMGGLVAAEYFGGETSELFRTIYGRVNFPWYVNGERNCFYMGYSYERGFWGGWDRYAEQIIMYVLGAASPTCPTDPSLYYSFARDRGTYEELEVIHTYTGSLFTYQFSHAWIDFRKIRDRDGIDWFENSVRASLANWKYCSSERKNYRTLHERSWGLTACDSPDGYRGDFGAPPSAKSNTAHRTDGTVPPCGALGSIVFVPGIVEETVKHYFENVPELWSEYGFLDAYNLDRNWVSDRVIGIDKGITLLMIENYRSGMIWELTMGSEYIKNGLERLGFLRREEW